MTKVASEVQAPPPAPIAPTAPAKPAPAYTVSRVQQPAAASTPFNAILLMIGLSLLGGVLAMLARGGLDRLPAVAGSSESLISIVFLAQVAVAVLCFAFLIRWMRS
jgi:hypothetical protein